MPKFVEMDQTVTLADQLKDEGGAVVLVNTFVVRPEEADRHPGGLGGGRCDHEAATGLHLDPASPGRRRQRGVLELCRLGVSGALARGLCEPRVRGAAR